MNKNIYLLLSLMFFGLFAKAQDFKFYPDPFTHIVNSSTIATTPSFPYIMPQTENDKWAEMSGSPSVVGTKYNYKDVENIVRVGVNHDIATIVPAYKYQVNLELHCKDYVSSAITVKYVMLEISYNPSAFEKYKDVAVYRFTGYHSFQAIITSVTDITSGSPVSLATSALATNFYVESEVRVQRYDLTPQKIVSKSTYLTPINELKVEWGLFDASSSTTCTLSTAGNDFKPITIELEWCYIDDYQYNMSTNSASYAFSTPGNINYDFRKNSTRVQISTGNSFNIPLLYEHGAIIYRLRTLRPDQTRYRDLEYGDWTLSDYGVVDASATSCFPAQGFIMSNSHLHDSLNWQYTINFAEEGKYKHVINYFDGSLKDRQTQTKINSDNDYIIAVDKIYDYEGRPSLVSLPTPIYGQNNLQYNSALLLHAATGNPYRAQDFDILGCTRPDSIPPLSSTAKANIYYSPLNPDKVGMQQYVPDAKGYPMVQTVYSPDNTNKVLWQGGAGQQQQLWKEHGTQYQYNRATQEEMDELLGSEVGYHQFYPKQIVTDPNGQSSYSILDPTGKVIISGLQGPNPDTSKIPIDTLGNFVRGELKCSNLLADYTQTKSGNAISAQLPVYNDDLGDASFTYSVQTFPFNTGCANQYLWAQGKYNMQVTNDCGTTMTLRADTVGETKVTNADGSAYAVTSPTVTGMPKGNYMATKNLSFSAYDIHHLVDSFVYANEPTCYNNVHYFVKKAIDSSQFPCAGFIDTTASHCDMMKKLMIKEMYPSAKYGGYTKDSLGRFLAGDTNSVFYRKPKAIGTPPRPYEGIGYKYIARTGYDGMIKLPVGAIDSNWKVTLDGINYYHDSVMSHYPPIGFEFWGNPISIIVDPPGPPFYSRSYFRAFINVADSIPLEKVFLRGTLGDHLDTIYVNGVANTVNEFGENYDVSGFVYGLNEVVFAGENDGGTLPLGHNFHSSFACGIVGYDPYFDFPYRDSCITLPDSVIKDGKVYKDLKKLPVQTLIEIFNDEIAEALLPLHPEYCKLQNCNDGNFEQILEETDSYQIAEENNMFYLDSLIAHDPLVYLSGGATTAFRLRYLSSTGISIDTMALQRAYCGAGNGEEYTYCAAKNFKNEIDNFTFLNDDIKQQYFANLKTLYIGNRTLIKQGKLDSTLNTCDTCHLARFTLTGVPVFPSLDKATAAGSSSGDADDSKYSEWMKALFRKGKDGDTTGMSVVPESLKDSLNAINLSFAKAQAENLLNHLKNCTLNETLCTNMYNAAINVLMSGRKLTPEIVQSIIEDTVSLSLSDLCHPFLVAYDLIPDTRPFTVAYSCGEDQLYADFLSFMQRTEVIDEIKAATTTISSGNHFPYSATNAFEKLFSSGSDIEIYTYMDGVSPVCSTCYVSFIVSSNLKTDTFHITPQDFRTQANITDLLNSSSPTYSLNNMRCINAEPLALATGYVAKNTAVLDATCGACIGNQTYYVWSTSTALMSDAPLASTLKNAVTCIDIKNALQDFKTDKSTFSYSEATNHPLYQYTLANYLNYKLNKSYTFGEYENLMEGCAITDQVALKKLTTTYRLEFNSDGAAASFATALYAYGSFKPDYFQYKPASGNPILFIDLNTIAQDTILAYKNYLDAYTSGVVSRAYNYNPTDDNTSLLFSPSACSFAPASFATVYSTETVSVWENEAYNTDYKLHTFRLSAATPQQEADMLADVNNYLHNTTLVSAPTCNVGYHFNGRALLRSADYNSTLKQEYLSYIYGLPSMSHDALIVEIDPDNLSSNLGSFASSRFTYNDPYCSGSRTHLYAYKPNPSPLPANAKIAKDNILKFVTANPFPNQDFQYVSGLGSRLAIIRKANGTFWYRYFDSNNHLYNLYIIPPSRQLGVDLASYTLTLGSFKIGAAPRTFTILADDGGKEIPCNGYADFELSDQSIIAENVILDKDPTGVSCYDSVDCEYEVLARAINNGKARYYQYYDSTVTQISNDMMTHLLNTTKDSLVYCGQKQQYQQTLYYYDLASNLTSTVPPAGVQVLSDVLLPTVKEERNSSTADDKMTTHKKESIYRYNSLNQLTYQHTPDGGSTYFFYDAVGRQIFSQNSKQRPQGKYSYSIYDAQGRPEESGEIAIGCTYPTDPLIDFDTTYCTMGTVTAAHPDYVSNAFNDALFPYESLKATIRANTRKEVVLTQYDEQTQDLGAIVTYKLKAQENLRSRVAAIRYFDELEPTPASIPDAATFATYYSYDISGNVKNIVYDFPQLIPQRQQYKSIDYDYDLISGKVNMISYNPGFPDQFYQQYDYDADNRITQVNTSNDGLIWNRDAQYQYYKHGPLANLKIGNQKIQSIEYAYTIQGWLKSINGDVLNVAFDMGKNGLSTATTPMPLWGDMIYARDVVAHALHYFSGDYSSIGGGAVVQLPHTTKELHNGNIAQQTTGIAGLGTMQRSYQYDQLQRLKMAANQTVDNATATLSPSPANLYRSSYSYDMDGNIKNLQRWDGTAGAAIQIDNFSYNYQAGNNNNKLLQVSDAAAPPTIGSDLQPGQLADNYSYDHIGNLTEDKQADLLIQWDRFGKVKTILSPPIGRDIHFGYDGKGNRIWKDVITDGISIGSGDKTHNAEYYVRDAGGNILATYRAHYTEKAATESESYPIFNDTISVSEHHIYGSSRLGVQRYDSSTLFNTSGLTEAHITPPPPPMPPLPPPPPPPPPSALYFLSNQIPWYSYSFADLIRADKTEPYGTDGNTYFDEKTESRTLGRRYYEMTDHLGNVLATVLDRKTGFPSSGGGGLYDYWLADLASTADYYPGGMMMPGRNTEHDWSRMGAQSQQKDDEVYGKGNLSSYLERGLDTRRIQWLTVDSKFGIYPNMSPYSAFAGNPIFFKDEKGETIVIYYNGGNSSYTYGSKAEVPDDDFVKQSIASLDKLSSAKSIARDFNFIKTTPKYEAKIIEGNTTIAYPQQSSFDLGKGKKIITSKEALIEYSPKLGIRNAVSNKVLPPYAVLWHEIGHFLDAIYDPFGFNERNAPENVYPPDSPDSKWTNPEEKYNIEKNEHPLSKENELLERDTHKTGQGSDDKQVEFESSTSENVTKELP